MNEKQALQLFLSEYPETLDDEMMDKFNWWLEYNEIDLTEDDVKRWDLEMKKPAWYFSHHFTSPHFELTHYNYGIFIGRVKEVGNDLVFNIYTPFFSCGYAW